MNKVALFGGTGFIGSYITDELLASNYNIKMLVRSVGDIHRHDKIEIIHGDLSDISTVKKVIQGSDIVIYAVGIIRENHKKGITFEKLHYDYFKNIVDISINNNVKKVIYISANGVTENGTGYQSSKYYAEQYLINNFNDWLIFRPSIVYGNPRGKIEFITQLKNDIIDKSIPAPLFFQNNPFRTDDFFKSNPIHINNLIEIIVQSISNDSLLNEIIELGGPNEINWKTILKTISKTVNKKKIFIPLPILFISIVALLLDRFKLFPITRTQIEMLKEGNTCNSEEIFEQLNIQPIPFTTDSIKYLQ